MEDRELLELAAKAAGLTGLDFDYCAREAHGFYFGPRLAPSPGIQAMCHSYWRPLEDDGDALRLSVKLQLTVCNEHVSAGAAYCTSSGYAVDSDAICYPEAYSGENEGEVLPADYAATRRAIVLAAAEIGRAMP